MSSEVIDGYTIVGVFPNTSKKWHTLKGEKNNMPCVLKRLTHSPDRTINHLLTVTPHDLLVRCIDRFEISDSHYLVFEHFKENFQEFMENEKRKRTDPKNRIFGLDKKILPWVTQVCLALVHLHEHGIVHCGLNPHNIFFLDVGNGEIRVKLGDYQACNMVEAGGSWVNEQQTPRSCYNAPETWLLRGNNVNYYRSNCDVWSLGCFAVELVNWQPLFVLETFDSAALNAKLVELRQIDFIRLSTNCSKFEKLVRKMLLLDIELRPDSHEILSALVKSGERIQKLALNYSYEEEFFYTPSMSTIETDESYSVLEPDSNGVYPPIDWFRDLSVWRKVAEGKPAELFFRPMLVKNTNRILEMVIVKRKRSAPPNMGTPNTETADVPSSTLGATSECVAKGLRIWARFQDDGGPEDLQISINMVLPYVMDLRLRTNLNLRKTRRLTVGREFQNVFLHFQPSGMTLVPDLSPTVTVRVEKINE